MSARRERAATVSRLRGSVTTGESVDDLIAEWRAWADADLGADVRLVR